MFYETDSYIGKITLDNAVLGSIIRHEAAVTEGRIILCGPKGKPVKAGQKKGGDDGSFFDFTWSEDRLDIHIYVIIKLGGSIKALAENLNNNLNSKIRELSGINPSSITVDIKGILSKNISVRDIQVTRNY